MKPQDQDDEPLPVTFAFVSIMGVAFFIGWLVMFFLLEARR